MIKIANSEISGVKIEIVDDVSIGETSFDVLGTGRTSRIHRCRLLFQDQEDSRKIS